jgi:hypothetical protein
MDSITAESSRVWIHRHKLSLLRYLRLNHKEADWDTVSDLIFYEYPDEGKKLVRDFKLPEQTKKNIFIEFLLESPQLVCGVLADERMGKDATLCEIFDDVVSYCRKYGINPPRIVTLGNIRKPPMVAEKDMFFSFKSIPSGTKDQEVWIYCSEIEIVIPSRETNSPESRLFAHISGTMAQNHQKLFGCCKLASLVDLNFWRKCNAQIVKFIQPEKLMIEGVEREGTLSQLAMWHLPKNKLNKKETLLYFDSQIFVVNYNLPLWWSDEYSEQFRSVPVDKVWEFAEVMVSNGMSAVSISTAIVQKFRFVLSTDEIKERFGLKK